MKTKNHLTHLVSLFCLALLVAIGLSCKHNQDVEPTSPNDGLLNEAAVTELDAKARVNLKATEIILPNGYTVKAFTDKLNKGGRLANGRVAEVLSASGPQQKKNLLITQMATKALELTNRDNFVYEKGADSTTHPAQKGLAYVYGSRDYSKRTKSKGTCKQELYGLDCSGFLLQLANAAGISIPNTTAAGLSDATTWENALRKMDGLNKVHVKDLGILSTDELESGDIVYWENSSGAVEHIGIVFKTSTGKLAIFDSHGSASSKCEANYGANRGPGQLALDKINTFFTSSGLTYSGTLRITTDISGSWELDFKCATQTQIAAKLNITFDPTKTGDFTSTGSGTDYNGSPLAISVKGQYDEKKNRLTLEMTTTFPDNPSDIRIDKITVELNEDETAFVTAQKIKQNNGCDLAIKLINKEK